MNTTETPSTVPEPIGSFEKPIGQDEQAPETDDRFKAIRSFFENRSSFEKATAAVMWLCMASDDPGVKALASEVSQQWKHELREIASNLLLGKIKSPDDGALEALFAASMLESRGQ